MTVQEELVEYLCDGCCVYGSVHVPERHAGHGLIVIGQYGAARLTLQICRRSAREGLPAFRFGFRGRGWCEGPVVDVHHTAEDIAAAIRAFREAVPGLTTFTVMGLSEGAAAALLFANSDRRITGLVLANPWLRLERDVAKQHLWMNVAKVGDTQFWSRIWSTEGGLSGSLRSLARLVRNAFTAPKNSGTLTDLVVEGLACFPGRVYIILGGEDPATTVFQRVTGAHVQRLTEAGRLTVHVIPEADHVFSTSHPRSELIRQAVGWTLEAPILSPSRD